MNKLSFRVPAPNPPAQYSSFIEGLQRFAAAKGVRWDSVQDWDIRKLTEGMEASARNVTDFTVDKKVRQQILDVGYASATVPQGDKLPPESIDFIKAVAANRAQRGRKTSTAGNAAHGAKILLSTTSKSPWNVDSEDVARLMETAVGKTYAGRISTVVRLINEELLSLHCPLSMPPQVAGLIALSADLNHRKTANKLPDEETLFELTRIVFQETPRTHRDFICFCAVQLLILTGLRINEILTLPANCIVRREHFDIVTGKPAGEVGGVSKSIGIRYFREKTKKSASKLVEHVQWIPERFKDLVIAAVERAVAATNELRSVLKTQHSTPTAYPESDLRVFKTIEGSSFDTSDLLFLVGKQFSHLPDLTDGGAPIATLRTSSLEYRLGIAKNSSTFPTLFETYSTSVNAKNMRLNAHSLRHLMNTELFRLKVPDTAITHQFGRVTVAQSYEYDHRNLAERLAFVSLPSTADVAVKKDSAQELVAKMVVSGAIAGSHLAESFKRIQAEHGDEAAFQYLAANSDGFHVTPYGFCTNSFSLNPCARHLKCFDNCRHFASSGADEHRVSLETLRSRLAVMRDAAKAKPAHSIGRKNQIASAERLLAGVDKALVVPPLNAVFPDGQDYSTPTKDIFA